MATKPELSKHFVTLDSDLIAEVWAWARGSKIKNRFTTHDAESKPELQASARLCEHAFSKWAGLPRSAVQLGSTADHDVKLDNRRVEIRSCEMWKRFLCWPATKVAEYDKRNFTDLVLVKFELMPKALFQIVGWITKKRFRNEKHIAPKGAGFRLDPGTWYMPDDALDDMNIFRGLICAQCGGGPDTDPPTDAPTIKIGKVFVHPECRQFWTGERYRRNENERR